MTKEIPLINTNLVALVDDADFEWLSKFKWYAYKKKHRGKVKIYAGRNTWTIGQNGEKQKHGRAMQRDILDPDRKLFGRSKMVNHKNRNTLDNQRSNLRFLTSSENSINCGNFLQGSASMRGVRFVKAKNVYRAIINVNGKRYVSEHFDSIEEAARAYNWLALKHHGEFARLNLDKDGQPLEPLPHNPCKTRK